MITKSEELKTCFAIMPISDPDGYEKGHFKHVYENIIKPSCNAAGYQATRADDVKEVNVIHIDILQKLLETPLAICDLSSRNPNVLFELGIRQAFDKPVVLIQEKNTPKIFDISPIRCIEYDKAMHYHDVIDFQNELKDAITATMSPKDENSSINSLVKLLGINPAKIPELTGDKDKELLKLFISRVSSLEDKIDNVFTERKFRTSPFVIEYQRLCNQLDNLSTTKRMSAEEKIQRIDLLEHDIMELCKFVRSDEEDMLFRRLRHRHMDYFHKK